jgi:hypothetical protein
MDPIIETRCSKLRGRFSKGVAAFKRCPSLHHRLVQIDRDLQNRVSREGPFTGPLRPLRPGRRNRLSAPKETIAAKRQP